MAGSSLLPDLTWGKFLDSSSIFEMINYVFLVLQRDVGYRET